MGHRTRAPTGQVDPGVTEYAVRHLAYANVFKFDKIGLSERPRSFERILQERETDIGQHSHRTVK